MSPFSTSSDTPYPLLHSNDESTAGVTQTSGFYGPGTWAAWILSMVSSLIALRREHDSHATLVLIPPILYIQWSAFDLIKQVYGYDVSLELVASSTGISTWGLWYLFCVQLMLTLLNNDLSALAKGRMHYIALIGLISPFYAVLAGTIYVGPAFNAEVGLPYKAVGTYFVPESIGWTPHLLNWFNHSVLLVIHTGLAVCQATIALRPGLRKRLLLRARRRVMICLTVFTCTCIVGTFVHAMVLFRTTPLREDDRNGLMLCLIKPCAPQSIKEPDQGFSLCLGLLLLIFEGIIRVRRLMEQLLSGLSRVLKISTKKRQTWPGRRN